MTATNTESTTTARLQNRRRRSRFGCRRCSPPMPIWVVSVERGSGPKRDAKQRLQSHQVARSAHGRGQLDRGSTYGCRSGNDDPHTIILAVVGAKVPGGSPRHRERSRRRLEAAGPAARLAGAAGAHERQAVRTAWHRAQRDADCISSTIAFNRSSHGRNASMTTSRPVVPFLLLMFSRMNGYVLPSSNDSFSVRWKL